MPSDGPRSTPRTASFGQVVVAVLSAFFGVRKRADHDAVRLKPMHVLAVALLAAATFVGTLLTIVFTITG